MFLRMPPKNYAHPHSERREGLFLCVLAAWRRRFGRSKTMIGAVGRFASVNVRGDHARRT